MEGNDIAIVVPVFREANNIAPLIAELHQHLGAYEWEVVFVDDASDDGTTDIIRACARADARVRLVLRVNERGLATAGVAGMLTTKARWIVVMDGDGQHDPKYIPDLIAPIAAGEADIVSAARSLDEVPETVLSRRRRQLSALANRLAGRLLRRQLVDPMSGFFAVRADSFWGSVRKLSNGGFKLLLDLLVSDPRMRHREIPFRFRERRTGESKLDLANSWQFLCFVLSKALGGVLPVRFVSFLLVGASGVIIHFITLYPALWFEVPFAIAQLGAALAATTWNFALNNVLTFRDRRLSGWRDHSRICKVSKLSHRWELPQMWPSRQPPSVSSTVLSPYLL